MEILKIFKIISYQNIPDAAKTLNLFIKRKEKLKSIIKA